MSVVDVVISSLPEQGIRRFENERVALFTDGDNTLFKPGTAELYADVRPFLDNSTVETIMLVSANPDEDLARERAELIGANYEIPKRRQWVKAGLFSRAIGRATQIAGFDRAVVLGDRFLMDVTVGKMALLDADIKSLGVLVRRPETLSTPPTRFDKLFLCPIERVGYFGSMMLRADGYFRPRVNEEI
ncbi:MAG: hypothetical protein M3P98_03265 [bacterium]|nr:hypothetical protein [bacterium]